MPSRKSELVEIFYAKLFASPLSGNELFPFGDGPDTVILFTAYAPDAGYFRGQLNEWLEANFWKISKGERSGTCKPERLDSRRRRDLQEKGVSILIGLARS